MHNKKEKKMKKILYTFILNSLLFLPAQLMSEPENEATNNENSFQFLILFESNGMVQKYKEKNTHDNNKRKEKNPTTTHRR